ncbi:hypothetical protein HanRHA438_Chr03g0136801 [Helianthus annuus]|nr:hypothetical protein HanRHA438_Chr03g0136801 [Helianthus annuus]
MASACKKTANCSNTPACQIPGMDFDTLPHPPTSAPLGNVYSNHRDNLSSCN